MTKTLEIFVVEDNAALARLWLEAIKEYPHIRCSFIASNGTEALEYLRTKPEKPTLVFLDLHLPDMTGLEVLTEIRNDPYLSHLPVIMLSATANEHDIFDIYKAHANCFIEKPHDLTAFTQLLQVVHHYWASVVTLPQP